jgi:hypothetical protein
LSGGIIASRTEKMAEAILFYRREHFTNYPLKLFVGGESVQHFLNLHPLGCQVEAVVVCHFLIF